MIILEGMDNSGKTTLANSLITNLKDHRVFKLSEVNSPTMEQLNSMLVRIKNSHFSREKYIFDRFSLISELVYGEVIRGESRYGTLKNWEMLLDYIRYNPFFLIYCRPPDEIILGDLDFSDQMKGVKDKSKKLIKRYDEVMININHAVISSPNPGIFIKYNWNDDKENAIDSFLELYRYQENT